MQKLNLIFLRYLMILLLFSALLLILFMPTYFHIYNFTLANELNLINERLQWGVSSLDTAINTLNNIAILTNRDSRFRIFTQDPHVQDRNIIKANPILLYELRNHFSGLLLPSSVISDAGIIFSRDIILTRHQIFYYPELINFYGNYIYIENLTEDEWFHLIQTTNTLSKAMYFSSSINNRSYMGLNYTVLWGGGSGIMYATFPVNNIIPLLAEDDHLSQSSVRIYDYDGNTLYYYTGDNWDSQRSFHTMTSRSEIIPIFFEIMVPEILVSRQMTPVRRLMLSFALLTVFFVICLSLSFAYKWSEPMRRLLHNIDSTKIFKNEYEQSIEQDDFRVKNYFRKVYTGLSKSISTVDNRLEDSLRIIEGQTSILKEQVFLKALFQGIYNEQDEQLFRSLFKDFPVFFQLALISYDLPSDSSFQKIAVFQLQLINEVKNIIGNIFVHSIVDNIILLLLPLTDKNESWYKKLQDLRNDLNQRTEEALHFSLSSNYQKPSDLPRAWQELQSIHIASGVENLISVVHINDISNQKKHIPFNITSLLMIYNALGNGSDDTACSILSECIAEFAGEKDMFILGLISNLLQDMLILLKTVNTSVLIHEEIPQYVRGREEELLKKEYPECFRRIGKLIRQNKEESISQFGTQILDYINENLYNPDLYSAMIQDHFNISQPTLQKLIKQVSGHTYLSYVETHRMAKAKELLSEGVYTIQEVSVKCGFSNTNSFYKAFKRMYGFPPSDINNRIRS